MVHVTVGTGNTICALMNAARDNVPLLLMAGRTPMTQSGHIASRYAPIHWGQENFDQAGVVREYTKWDFELRAGQPADEVLGRALDIALSEPRGPVYLTLPREVLASADASARERRCRRRSSRRRSRARVTSTRSRVDRGRRVAADPDVEPRPRLGRPSRVLAELAERHAIPVAQPHASCVNLPASHALNSGHAGTELLAKADLMLVADCEVPWYPRYSMPRDDAKVVHLGVDPLFERYPHPHVHRRSSRSPAARARRSSCSTTRCNRGPRSRAAAERRRAAIKDFKAKQAAERAAALERARTREADSLCVCRRLRARRAAERAHRRHGARRRGRSLRARGAGHRCSPSASAAAWASASARRSARSSPHPTAWSSARSATAATCSATRRRFISSRARRSCRR